MMERAPKQLDFITIRIPRDIAEDWLEVLREDYEGFRQAHNPNDYGDPMTRRAYALDKLLDALGYPMEHQKEYGF